jgi:small-conductance mechanosensitive channel
VLASYEAKGGDGTEYRKFMAATSQIDVNLFDPQAVGAFLRTWVVAPEGGIKVGLNILWFVVIIVATWFISVLVAGAVRTSVRRLPKASSLLQDFLVGGAKRIVLLIGIVIAVSYLGVNVTPSSRRSVPRVW